MEQSKDGKVSSERHMHVAADLWKYGKGELLDGQLTVEACAATYIDKKPKGEDRHVVLFGNKEMEDCQQGIGRKDDPRMAAFFGVFDGHDGARAAEYCYKGLLPHILSETQHCMQKQKQKQSRGSKQVDSSPLETGTINAFHRAQARFANKLSPPTFQDVKQGVKATRFANMGRITRAYSAVSNRRKPRGGTTALTLSIYGECVSGDAEAFRPMPCAMVANTGDCRLITDDGTGSYNYRQVTTDHRPEDPDEHDRLSKCVEKGTAVLGREVPAPSGGVLRVYPGGLAVSRSIGDLNASPAIICTPDIFQVPITGDEKTHRLVLASDGLWDVMSNEEVGHIVSRLRKKNETVHDDVLASASATDEEDMIILDPNEAASRLMEVCLHNGGHMDDVTILIVDVKATSTTTKQASKAR